MISRTSAERVLNAALATGGDFAELYMEDGESHSISMLDGVVENAAYSRGCAYFLVPVPPTPIRWIYPSPPLWRRRKGPRP